MVVSTEAHQTIMLVGISRLARTHGRQQRLWLCEELGEGLGKLDRPASLLHAHCVVMGGTVGQSVEVSRHRPPLLVGPAVGRWVVTEDRETEAMVV